MIRLDSTMTIQCMLFTAADPIEQEVAQPVYRTRFSFFSPSTIKKVFEQFFEVDRAIQIVVKDNSSLKPADCTWYTHHGTYTNTIPHSICPEGSSTIIFQKTNYIFFGVSGYFEYTHWRKETRSEG